MLVVDICQERARMRAVESCMRVGALRGIVADWHGLSWSKVGVEVGGGGRRSVWGARMW